MNSDRNLIAALLAGDEAAFSALVDRLHPRILRLCRRFVASSAAAEDAAQDTWQAVLQGLPSSRSAARSIPLRDIELLTAAEVCEVLELSEENQRVLLHRARARLRAQLEQALLGSSPACDLDVAPEWHR